MNTITRGKHARSVVQGVRGIAPYAPVDSPQQRQWHVQREGKPVLDSDRFGTLLCEWYRLHARVLPWRSNIDPYRTWVSEIMLQQTRVNAVIEHYRAFLERFPTVVSLALARESEVLAAWSGLGYYRRARMLHKAAQFVVVELGGVLPRTSGELRTLPGVGEYTSAAIASIAFGEHIAVVDGNVERVILRITGRPEDTSAASRTFVREIAALLMPKRQELTIHEDVEDEGSGRPHPLDVERTNPAGDHNQAMMELGATICLPRAPICLNCPVFDLCQTQGEHVTRPRGRQVSRPAAYLLVLRKQGTQTEVLLERRSAAATLMPGMLELPPLPFDVVAGMEPVLRVRHSITNTNYYVQVFGEARGLRGAVVAAESDLIWTRTGMLGEAPLTGLARKVLRRLRVAPVVLHPGELPSGELCGALD